MNTATLHDYSTFGIAASGASLRGHRRTLVKKAMRVFPSPNRGTQHLKSKTWPGFQTQVCFKPNPENDVTM